MEYMKCRWHHDDDDYAVWIHAELDEERWEVRKLEIYRDGSIGYATEREECGVHLGLVPVPPLEEIAQDSEFQPERISREEFERVLAAHGVGKVFCRKHRWRMSGPIPLF